MPELPEVETIRQDLRKRIINQKIIKVQASSKAIFKGISKNSFLKLINNKNFQEIERVGKLIIFVLSDGKYMLVHLKMTGQLVWLLPHPNPPLIKGREQVIAGGHPEPSLEQLPNKFTRVIFEFTDGGKLYFNDIRRFGYMQIVDKFGLKKIKEKFGLEPLDKNFDFNYFKKVLSRTNKSIKVALLDQDKISGIGNIYASEICFEAGVKPQKKVGQLSEKELKLLHQACIKILKIAIENRGTTFSDYVDVAGRAGYNISFLKVYDRKGLKCKRKDGGIITKINLGGRGSFYCSVCQK